MRDSVSLHSYEQNRADNRLDTKMIAWLYEDRCSLLYWENVRALYHKMKHLPRKHHMTLITTGAASWLSTAELHVWPSEDIIQ